MEENLTIDEKRLVDAFERRLMHHQCAFKDPERKILHDFIDAVNNENADHETHIIVLRIGNNIRDAVRKATKWVIWVLLLGIAAFFGIVILHW